MSLRSDLARARGLGSAHDGVEHWISQRLTAIANILLISWFLIGVLPLIGDEREALIVWMSSPVNAAVAALMFISIFWHAALGLQVVIEDYLHTPWMKVAGMVASKFLCAALGAIAVVSVLKMALGG